MLAIAEFANEQNDWKCFPSIETLAQMVGVTDRQMKRNLMQLEGAGELIIDRKTGRGNSNVYDLSPMIKGDIYDIKGDTHDTICEEEKVTSEAEKVTPVTIKGDMDVTPTNKNQKERYIYDPLLEAIQPIRTALNGIIKRETDKPGFDADKFIDASEVLYGRDATPDQVTAFGGWWKSNGWHDDTPVLKNVINNWADFLAGKNLKNPSSNGNGHHLNGSAALHAFEIAWDCAGRGRLDTEDEKIKQAARRFGFSRLRQWNPEFKSTAQKEFIGIYNGIE